MLNYERTDMCEPMLTCRIVTGTLTPWSFQMAVIPRLRAISPVRIELAVHFGVFFSGGVASEELDCAGTTAGALSETGA